MEHAKKEWLALEQFVHQFLRIHEIQNTQVLLAVSGGLDSVALLRVMNSLKGAAHLNLHVCYVHHGLSESSIQNQYRDQSSVFLKQLCEDLKLPFHTNPIPVKSLQSEAEFREARYRFLHQIMEQNQLQFLATAHHSEDLLETRLIRLIRGVGPDGLESMMEVSGHIFRPFLRVSKQDLKTYLNSCQQQWCEDPSNYESDYLRNWLRHHWLEVLEKEYPGANLRLAESLQNISDSVSHFPFAVYVDTEGIRRSLFMVLSREEKRRVLAYYLNILQVKNFTANHLNEIIKYLDISQTVHTFKIAGCYWQANAERISVRVVAPPAS